MVPYPRTWFAAWAESTYGPDGFWPTNTPPQHFRTAAHDPAALATLVAGLLDRQPGTQAVVEVGAGRGELLTALARLRPGLRLTGIDLRPRPVDLPTEVAWVHRHMGRRRSPLDRGSRRGPGPARPTDDGRGP